MDPYLGDADYAFTAEFYDNVTLYQNRPDVDFYVECAKEIGGPVLELGCGTGRVLLPTAREGISITGLDRSPSMLDECRKRLADEPKDVQERVRLFEADMRHFELDQSFGMITIPFRPFQHLITVEDQLSCLHNARNHLFAGGRLVFDIFNPSLKSLTRDNLGEEVGEQPPFTMPDGQRVVRWDRVVSRDLFNQINHVELIYYVTHPDGREERLVHAFPMRYLFRYEAEHLLVRSGFEIEHVYADFDKNPYGSIYPGDLIFIAKRS
jgi:SAM-dependent methyltransferase